MNNDSPKTSRCLIRAAGILGFLGVALGAFGAHALAGVLESAGRVETWETAVFYHLAHAIALLGLASWSGAPARRWIARLWVSGTVIFSGSLYLLCVTGITWLGGVTPLGGLCLLGGWGWLVFARNECPASAEPI